MGRHATGWTIRLPKGRNVWLVRFQHEGRTVERSTGEADRGAATKVAAATYSRVALGIVAPAPAGDLVAAMAAWLADYSLSHTPETTAGAEGYARGFIDFFRGFDRLTGAGYADYMRQRIGKVSRSTLRKELSALRMFTSWAKVERGIALTAVPGLPKVGHAGARGKNARRRVATVLTSAEVGRLIAAMPVKGPRSGAWLRPFFALAWETGLRPYSTLAKLEAPLHYRKGSETLFIGREIDKARYERTIPLTPAAREALDLVVPASGSLFPGVSKDGMREALASAVRATGIGKTVSVYDFRHSRISQLANSGAPLAGVSFLVGHKDLSTTARYVQASAAAGLAALMAAQIPGAETGAHGSEKVTDHRANGGN